MLQPVDSQLILLFLVIDMVLLSLIILNTRKKVENMDNVDNAPVEAVPGDARDELMNRIIELLVEHGGSMYQSEIRSILGVPKSTLHKVLTRMAQDGIVEIRKEGRFNVVSLKVGLKGNPGNEARPGTESDQVDH